MNDALFTLLHRCTVKVWVGNESQGSAFFVAPGLALTCAHVVKPTQTSDEQAIVLWQNGKYPATVESYLPDADLALLRLPFDQHPCVLLNTHISPTDKLYLYGYPGSTQGSPAESTTVDSEGWRYEVASPSEGLIKFKEGQIKPGLSGSPVLNLKTGCVCGVTKRTRDKETDLGGFAIPTDVVFSRLSALRTEQEVYHQQCTEWLKKLTPEQIQHGEICLPEPSRPDCPYLGLFSFTEKDEPFFFGRGEVTGKLVQAVHSNSMTVVIGSSGSGKSSVVFAGLVPQLRREGNWQILGFRPGERPFHDLSATLLSVLEAEKSETDRIIEMDKMADALLTKPGLLGDVCRRILEKNASSRRLLLICDQFEQLYTRCQDASIRQKFLAAILSLRNLPNVKSIIILRADFMGYALAYGPFAEAIQDGNLYLSSMRTIELQEVVEEPARKQGITFEQGLTRRIVKDVQNQPGYLPLLEFALSLLWHRQSGKVITHEAYDTIGGVQEALASYADKRFAMLGKAEQQCAERIFIQLVRPGKGTDDTRRHAKRSELDERDWEIVLCLADARLVVTGQDESSGEETVEIVHEALIYHWQRLKDWMTTHRQFRLWQERLKVQMPDEALKPGANMRVLPRDSLLRGARLVEAEDWLKQRNDFLSEAERSYIQESLDERARLIEAERKEREEEQERQKRLAHRRKWTYRAALATSVIFVALASLAGWQANRARQYQARILYERGNIALQETHDIPAAEVLFAKSLSLSETMQTRTGLIEARARGAQLVHSLSGSSGDSIDIFFDQDEHLHRAVVQGTKVVLSRVPVMEGQEIPPDHILIHTSKVTCVEFNSDGHLIASGDDEGHIIIWDSDTGDKKLTLKYPKEVDCLAFSSDNRWLAASGDANTVLVWDIQHPNASAEFKEHSDVVLSLAFSPDSQWLASTGRDREVYLHKINGTQSRLLGYSTDLRSAPDTHAPSKSEKSPQTQSKSKPLYQHEDVAIKVAFSPDGKQVISMGKDLAIRFWDIVERREKQPRLYYLNRVFSVAFSPDRRLVAFGDDIGTVHLYDLQRGTEVQSLHGFNTSVHSVTFHPKGHQLAAAAPDGTIKLWNISERPESRALRGHIGAVSGVAISPDGKILASASQDHSIRLWDTASGELLGEMQYPQEKTGPDSFLWIAFSPDGTLLASGSEGGWVRIYEVATRRQIRILKKHDNAVWGVAFQPPDGKLLATADSFGNIRLWNVATGVEQSSPAAQKQGAKGRVLCVVFSPDGQRLAFGDRGGTVRIWDVGQSQSPRVFPVKHRGAVWGVAFSPDGQWLVTGGEDKSVVVWDVQTGKDICTLMGHTGEVWSVAYGPQDWIASASLDGTVRVWDAKRQKELFTLRGHDSTVWCVTFSPKGDRIASGGLDRIARIWDIKAVQKILNEKPQDLLQEAEQATGLQVREFDATLRSAKSGQ